MSRTLHLFGTDWCAMMVPIQVIRWYRMQCYDGTDSCATVVPIRRYCQIKNVLSVSNRQGFIKQSDQFENRNIASEDTSNYKIVEQNNFAFNPARINVGSIARLTTFEKGIVSPMYICFRTQENVAPEYIDFFFESKHFYCEIQKRLEGSVRQCLSFEGLCNIPFSLPSLEIQQRIGKRLFTLGQKIKTETDLLELLNKQKLYLLRQMFI